MKELLRITEEAVPFGVAAETWQAALAHAHTDDVVAITHAALDGDVGYRLHVAKIPQRVGAHFHGIGNEDYGIVQGKGLLHYGPVKSERGVTTVDWQLPVEFTKNQRFVIPEGYAHQLESVGKKDLVIIFGCPDAHLQDDQDRHMLRDSPNLGATRKPSAKPTLG